MHIVASAVKLSNNSKPVYLSKTSLQNSFVPMGTVKFTNFPIYFFFSFPGAYRCNELKLLNFRVRNYTIGSKIATCKVHCLKYILAVLTVRHAFLYISVLLEYGLVGMCY